MPGKKITRESILLTLERELPFLRAKYGVEKIALFGSFAQASANESSDIDLLVKLAKPLGFEFMQLADYLEDVLERKVDLITFDSLERSASNPRRAHIAKNISRSMIYV